MRTSRKLLALLGLLLAVGLAMANTTALVAASKDELTITAGTTSGGFTPSSTGAPPEWFYDLCVPHGGSLNVTIPVEFQLSGSNITSGSATISFGVAGSPAVRNFVFAPDGTTLLKDFSFSLAEGGDVTETFVINTGVLSDGVYNVNIQIAADPSREIHLSHDTIHISVLVGDGCAAVPPTCFFTDSNFIFLNDCSGNEVRSSSGGTFAIVANARGRVVSTNPGQFYYNLIWTNTGATRDVTITLSAGNLVPQGANALHALVFDTSEFVEDKTNWDMVNQDGVPCGPSGPCTLSVEAGKTLWITWHLAYSKIGMPLSSLNLSSTCSEIALNNDGTITAMGTLTDSSGNVLTTCLASAQGYLKK